MGENQNDKKPDAMEEMRRKAMTNLPELDEESKRRLRMTRRHYKPNLFDIVIILVILALGVGVYLFANREVAAETKTLRYTIELSDMPEGFSEKVEVGDDLTDNIKNYYMGKVVQVDAVPFTKLADDMENGKILDSVVPERESVLIVVEANVTESASEFRVNGNFLVKAGLEIAAKGPGYAGEGYILTVER